MAGTSRLWLSVVSLSIATAFGAPDGVPPEVAAHMTAMGQALKSAPALRFRARGLMDEALASGQLVQIQRTSKITLQRPDALHVSIDGDDVDWEMWVQGKTLTLLDRAVKEWTSLAVPPSIDEVLDAAVAKHGLTIPVSDLLYSDAKEILLEHVTAARYIGKSRVGPHTCHHLAFRQEVIDWQIWIDAGEVPLPRKFVISYKQEPGMPQYVAVYDKWDLAPKIPPSRFEFKPPSGSRELAFDAFLNNGDAQEVIDEKQ
jgi:hypothetical protein